MAATILAAMYWNVSYSVGSNGLLLIVEMWCHCISPARLQNNIFFKLGYGTLMLI